VIKRDLRKEGSRLSYFIFEVAIVTLGIPMVVTIYLSGIDSRD
jgi:hypothetical protein